jgi:hypothetical protein
MRQEHGGLVGHQIDLLAEQILQGRTTAAIMHQGKLGVGQPLRQHRGQMRSRPDTGGGHRHRVLIGLEPGHQFEEIAGRQGFPRGDEMGIGRQQHHRLEILHQIVWQCVDRTAGYERAPIAAHESITVGHRARDPTEPDGATRAAHILDDDRLPQARPQTLAQPARQHIGRTARSERNHDRDRMRRLDLCARWAGDGEADERQEGFEHSNADHGVVSWVKPLEPNRFRLNRDFALSICSVA